MPVPLNFLKAAGKAVVKYCGNAVGFGFAGDLLVEYGPAIVEDIWEAWGKKKKEEERRVEIEAVAQAAAQEVVHQVAEIVREVAADQPPEFQQMLGTYLTQVPAMVQKSLRRQSDPTGRSVAANHIPRKAEDLLAFLPPKLPRFKPGDRPLPGVDWELEQLLGVGGFGEVWKARNPHFDGVPPVALKFCLDNKAKEQLLRHEAVILNQVMRQGKHPGIVQLLRTYLSADPPCLEYEYIEDGDLAGIIKDKNPKPDIVAKIMLRLADIVGFAHRLNPPVVHRDLKPANILVRQTNDKKFVLKVADFGIGGLAAAQAIGEASRGTSRGKFLVSALQGAYTPLYASPQQMRAEPPDPRDDVFSLGVIWYQMLTGSLITPPPTGRRWRDKLADAVPSPILDLLETCFEDDPNDRPKNAAAMAEKLRGMLGESSQQPVYPAVSPAQATAVPPTPKKELVAQPTPQQRKERGQPKPGGIITNSLGMKFAWIPPGTFLMGSPPHEADRRDDETQHKVTLTKGFYMGVYTVTQEQWQAVMGNNPSGFRGEKNLPVEQVSWNHCQEFVKKLRDKDKKLYRLPTEAEWEYACRAGTTTPFHFGETISTDQVNYNGNTTFGSGTKGSYREKTMPVGSFPANAWGLYDTHGNVWEWCQDFYDVSYYTESDGVDPECSSGTGLVTRGGGWHYDAGYCRAAIRSWYGTANRNDYLGFRLALVPSGSE